MSHRSTARRSPARRALPHHWAGAAGVALSLLLGGCAGRMSADDNRTLNSVHQPVVRLENFAFDADTRAGELLPSEAARLNGWFDALNLRYGDRVAIDISQGDPGRVVRDGVIALASRRGLLLAEAAPLTPGAIPPGYTRIVVSRASAHVAGCPNWSDGGMIGSANRTSSNYGCATNANLAAMIADSTDLVRGTSARQSDPLTASKAIRAYRNAPPSGASGAGGSGGGGATSSTASSGGGRP